MLKFSIRELFLFTVVVGLALGWWLDRTTLARDKIRREECARNNWERLKRATPFIVSDDDFFENHVEAPTIRFGNFDTTNRPSERPN